MGLSRGLVVCKETIRANLMAELPFLACENILLGAVTQGADRQEAHKILRRHSRAAAERIRTQRGPNDLLERLRGEPMFAKVDLDAALELSAMVGLAPAQVDRLIEQVVEPIRLRYAEKLREKTELGV